VHGRLLGALVAGALLTPSATALAAEPPASVTLSGTARDFRGYDLPADAPLPRGHIDFEHLNGGAETGIVMPRLGGDGLPVYAKDGDTSANTNGRAAFDQWFRDVTNVNLPESLALTLVRQSDGTYEYDAPSFFPLDGSGWVRRGREPTRTGSDGRPHNFSFTVELHSELRYTGDESIAIRGDDDIWLFVNGHLALDLGGVHGPLGGTVVLAQRAAALGLTPGRLYDLDLFVAERHTSSSSLRVDVPSLGFPAGTANVTATSARPIAGDVLTCETSGWHGDVSLSYAWLRDGEPIDGATAATYATTDADGGRALACVVTGSRRTAATTTSDPIAIEARADPKPPPPPPPPPPPLADPPAVRVTEPPSPLTNLRQVRVVFATDPAAAAYECRIDDGPWTSCASPWTVDGLNGGDHRAEVRAVTADGRRGPAAVHGFQVNPYPPGLTVAAGPLKASRAVALALTCSPREGEGRGACLGTAELRHTRTVRGRRRTTTLGRARFETTAGRTATPSIRLTRGARTLLAKAGARGLRVRVVLDANDLAGNRATTSVVRTLTRAPR
jgi:fibro-slime domain-containing protein